MELIRAANADCGELQSEARRIHGLLDIVYAKIAKRKIDLATYNAALSPARRLPPELVADIFLLCHTEPAPLLAKSEYDKLPLILGQICSGWREVALNTPQLWSNFAIDVPPGQSLPGITEGSVESWFSRSGAHPLSMEINMDNRRKTRRRQFFSSDLQRIMEVVATYAGRIKDLRLVLPGNPIKLNDPFQHIPRNSFALLESAVLHLDFTEGLRDPKRWQGALTAFKTAPHLKRLDFMSSLTTPFFGISERTGLTVVRVYLPWAQLTHFNFHRVFMNPEGCHYVLRLCSKNLVECSIILSQDHDDSLDHFFKEITMPKLETLNLQIMRKSEFGEFLHPSFLESLILPALKEFSFSSYNKDNGPTKWCSQVPYEGLLCLLSHSQLERFSFASVVICSRKLVELLRPMTSLVELNLHSTLFIGENYRLNKPFKSLSRTHDPFILPKLRIITVDLRHTEEMDFFEMVGSRLPRRDGGLPQAGSLVDSPAYLKKVSVNAVDSAKRYKYLDDEENTYFNFLRLDVEICVKRSGESSWVQFTASRVCLRFIICHASTLRGLFGFISMTSMTDNMDHDLTVGGYGKDAYRNVRERPTIYEFSGFSIEY